jgi:hypothetical protein
LYKRMNLLYYFGSFWGSNCINFDTTQNLKIRLK